MTKPGARACVVGCVWGGLVCLGVVLEVYVVLLS